MNDDKKLKVQTAADGSGPLYHRIYKIEVPASETSCRAVMRKFQADINAFSPQLIASFTKTKGVETRLCDGDEFAVNLSAPVPAPVRVKDCKELSFALATLEDHIEAGEISFSLEKHGGAFVFKIESYARSRDGWIDFFYDKVPIARFAQSLMWQQMCQAFARACVGDGQEIPEVTVLTEKRAEGTAEWVTV